LPFITLLILLSVNLIVADKAYPFSTFHLACNVTKTASNILTGNLYAMADDLSTPAVDYTLVRIDMNASPVTVTKIGTTTYDGANIPDQMTVDGLHNKIFVRIRNANCHRMVTINALTGAVLYDVPVSGCNFQNPGYDIYAGHLVGLSQNNETITFSELDYTNGTLASSRVVPDITSITTIAGTSDYGNGGYLFMASMPGHINDNVFGRTGFIQRTDYPLATLIYSASTDDFYGLGDSSLVNNGYIYRTSFFGPANRIGGGSIAYDNTVAPTLDDSTNRLVLVNNRNVLVYNTSSGAQITSSGDLNYAISSLRFIQHYECCLKSGVDSSWPACPGVTLSSSTGSATGNGNGDDGSSAAASLRSCTSCISIIFSSAFVAFLILLQFN